MDLTQEILKKHIHYDPIAGKFIRLIKTSFNAQAGSSAGYVNNNGYKVISVMNKQYFAHRLAWLYVTGKWPNKCIDHIDGNPSNCKFNNLRECSHGENMQNMRKPAKNNSSGYLGVSWITEKRKFCAQIKNNNKKIFIGYFDDPLKAHEAYVLKKRELHSTCSI